MLTEDYKHDITIKHNRTGDNYAGYTYQTKVIKGAVVSKTKTVLKSDGKQIITSNVLNAKELLHDSNLIVWNGKDNYIQEIKVIYDNFDGGGIDHFEYMF